MDENREEMALQEEALPEAKFRVETTFTAQVQLEAAKQVRSKIFEVATWVFIGLCLAMCGILLWQYLTAPWKDGRGLLMIFVLLVSVGMSLYSKFFAQKKALKRWETMIQRRFGGPALHLTTEFFDLSLCQIVQETGDSLVEGYSAMERMVESEHLFLLKCGRQSWFFLAKDGFTKGSPEEFRTFISEKIGGK